jgi:chromatin remodeling complex protein RSC6
VSGTKANTKPSTQLAALIGDDVFPQNKREILAYEKIEPITGKKKMTMF